MASQYASPKVPAVPSTTPASIRARLRAPVYNPYDKFTGEEFDAWIGDLTSRIRRVLAHEEPLARIYMPPSDVGDVSAYDEGELEDSFAEVKARRAAKGKQRADMDDSREEEFVESIIFPNDDEEQDGDAQEKHSDDERDEQDVVAYSDEEEVVSTAQGGPETIEISSDEDDELPSRHMPVLEEEPEGDDGTHEEDNEHASEPYPHRPDLDDEEEVQPESDVAEEDFPPRDSCHRGVPSVEISDPWVGPSTFSEDFYSGGDLPESALRASNPHCLPTETPAETPAEEVEVRIDELEEEFPPSPPHFQPVEISDPWSGPRMYAEDFYSGGEIRGDPSMLTPSHLTPMALTPSHEDDVGMVLTPGILSPSSPGESPRAIYDVDEFEDVSEPEQYGTQVVAGYPQDTAEEVPTFSMPPSKGGQDTEVDWHSFSEVASKRSGVEPGTDTVAMSSAPEPSASSPGPSPHERSTSPCVTAGSHVDWNFPPAFSGRAASAAGRLQTPSRGGASPASPPHAARSGSPEIVIISDDEEDGLETDVHDTANIDRIGNVDKFTAENGDRRQLPISVEVDSVSPAPHHLRQLSSEIRSEECDYDEFESLYFSSEFHELEQEPSLLHNGAHEEHFEPVFVQDADFGDLPANIPPGANNSHGTLSPESELLSVLGQFDESDTPENANTNEHSLRIPLFEVSKAADVEIASEVPVTEGDVHEGYREGKVGRELTPPDIAVLAYEVVEAESDVESDNYEVTSDKEFDVQTDHDNDSVVDVDYTVEETLTGGRRTEEAEERGEEAHSTVLSDNRSAEPTGGTVDGAQTAEVETSEHTLLAETVYTTLSDVDITQIAATDGDRRHDASHDAVHPTEPKSPPSLVVAADFGRKEEHPTEPMGSPSQLPKGLASTSQSSFHFENHLASFGPGIPMPVSADPSVPDPASIFSTPNSPGSPVSVANDMVIERTVSPGTDRHRGASAIPTTLLKHLSGHKSISGLFTPLSVTDSSPAESLHDSAQSDDDVEKDQLAHDEGDVSKGEVTDQGIAVALAPGAGEVHGSAAEVDMSTSSIPSAPPWPEAADSSTERTHPETGEADADADGDIDSDYAPSDDIQSSRERSQPRETNDSRQPPEEIVSVATGIERTLVASLGQIEGPAEAARQQNDDSAGSGLPQASQPAGSADKDESQLAPATTKGSNEDVEQESLSISEVKASYQTASGTLEVEAKEEALEVEKSPENAEISEGPQSQERLAQLDSPGISSLKTLIIPDEPRPLKRKRREPTPVPPRMTRSMSAKGQVLVEQVAEPASKDKGKQRALENPPADDDAASIALTVLSEGSSISTNLEAISEYPESSRAGSIVSSAPMTADSASSPIAEPRHLHDDTQPALPVINAQGLLQHHHHHVRPQERVVLAPETVVRPATEPHAPQTPPCQADTERIPSETSSSSAVLSTSPVTRSNCRFHKITLPREEGGPRISFVVPGCSLSDKDLMEQEQIEDHGPAKAEDLAFLIPDIESLDLGSYLLGVLRQLVGVDLLREQEVFYLEQPGEQLRFKGKRGLKHRVRESISGRNALGPQVSQATSARRRRPTLNSDSISTAGSVSRKARLTRRSMSVSISVSDDDMGESESKPKAKRRRANVSTSPMDPSPIGNPDLPTMAETQETASSQPVSEKRRVRRSRRLGVDAAAYKPNPSEEGESENDDKPAKSGRRKATRNRKRTRRDDADQIERTEEVIAKKRKVRRETGDAEEHIQVHPQSEQPAV